MWLDYNERKLTILEAVDNLDLDEATSQEVYEHLIENGDDVGLSAVQMALLRYHRQGLLSRRKIESVTRVYTLTDKGLERLKWLKAAFSDYLE